MVTRGRLLTITAPFILVTTLLAQSSAVKLRPSDEYWDRGRRAGVHFSNLSGKRRLATVGDTLYVFTERDKLIWTWSTGGAPLTDTPVEDASGVIYVIGFDLTWVALDSATGKEKWKGTANGRAVYSQIELYKGDKYLVVTDMTGYRENSLDKTIEDELTLCRGNSILWETPIPAGARIEVRGSKVYWAVRHKGRLLRREIPMPRAFGKPLGKVSTLAEYN